MKWFSVLISNTNHIEYSKSIGTDGPDEAICAGVFYLIRGTISVYIKILDCCPAELKTQHVMNQSDQIFKNQRIIIFNPLQTAFWGHNALGNRGRLKAAGMEHGVIFRQYFSCYLSIKPAEIPQEFFSSL